MSQKEMLLFTIAIQVTVTHIHRTEGLSTAVPQPVGLLEEHNDNIVDAKFTEEIKKDER